MDASFFILKKSSFLSKNGLVMFLVKKKIWFNSEMVMLNKALNNLFAIITETTSLLFFIIKIPQPEDKAGLVFPLSLIANKRELS